MKDLNDVLKELGDNMLSISLTERQKKMVELEQELAYLYAEEAKENPEPRDMQREKEIAEIQAVVDGLARHLTGSGGSNV